MAGRLEGKVCVITGAGGGMGADAAVRFAEEGAEVAVADVDGAAAEKVAGEVGGVAVQVDVSDEASVEAMYAAAAERFGGVDVLYNNAGISPGDDASILETGVLSINSNSSVRPSTPFGGFKQSGFGRELGMHALDGYSEIKNVYLATG